MNETEPAVVLLDPLKNGAGYKKAALDMGLAVVAVYTLDPQELKARWPDHTDGDDVSLYAPDAAGALAALRGTGYAFRAVVPAFESAVHLADAIAHELGLPGNEASLAWARRNKAAMRAHAAEAGVRIPAFRLVHDFSQVPAAAAEVGYPAIVKPTMDAGANGVTLISDARAAENVTIDDDNALFGSPKEWLVEQYIRGREFAVNCFSSDGDHRVIDMWEYRQPDSRDYDFPLWDNVQATPEDPDWERVAEHVAQVLTAFGVRRGPSHTEVKVASDGVYLIEVGARLPGGPATDQWVEYTDIRPFHDALECYLGRRPEIMDKPLGSRALFGAIAIRNDDAPGTLVAVHGLDKVRERPAVDKVLVSYEPGDHVPVTHETKTIPVGAWVSAPDQQGVVRALAEIRAAVTLEITPDPQH
ncbi:ATP-grasp domain-containing protein [Streptomyces olivoreticuli]|uniref:ATP-grasp domain-containing protein n=1 Tax=Streptomyces olivoreticuli TaxID=68246 RepID=UPI00265ABB1E|nr:ATP-grasp domain-containing protein [Streptomyces olivoreticuli]WKK24427.1 ATP-grasp domain-containing protein [Streptomyces olivoreticuli]